MAKLIECACCGKTFVAESANSLCSNECRKIMRRKSYEKNAQIRYGRGKKVDRVSCYETWEQRFDRADYLTKCSMLNKVMGVSYGQIQTMSAPKFNAIVREAKKKQKIVDELAIQKIIDYDKQQEEEKRLAQERKAKILKARSNKVDWEQYFVPIDQRTGNERCRDCRWLDPNEKNKKLSGTYLCKCQGIYRRPSTVACKRHFGY